MTITDEILEKAYRAANDNRTGDDPELDYCSELMMRAALEAVAPLLIARGMREAAEMTVDGYWSRPLQCARRILDRAQELDPQ